MKRRTRHEEAWIAVPGRGQLGRRRNLATLGTALGGLVVGSLLVVALASGGAASASQPVRGSETPLHRSQALAGALQLERPACPVPSRVAGALRLSSGLLAADENRPAHLR